uniref:NADH dehydrogenase [ubiquinone] 1 alpha subcomplex subunit 12 n=1 Tax=Leptocylindrus danicus TaxID=163516 RepID=A0A7S2KG35_9STRA|mmetsp:Transcript_22516/g.33762  ORF Transcript_22516/g.33762 Transcript_22516/m.33762 type:complete len:257 (+) Transcript_22516:72-842(+)|eukprot:CAMPEP_0116028596 /NCGR_PEP_ID=MMETSP0321-20121206/15520_1 /TAXON_ID=163516 /ORGANISM="Leptocylindrus danicus var. danicus, Strain B650" /LENGTH=256 /DNA_ID=CAMNT_0003502575 /DNA_START=72 /DNA_END=842 /DNA_ORIENTATION=-
MVYGVVQNFQQALRMRGGWKGLLTHMYTNGDYPFKFGTLMGVDSAGNKYYENRVDYPFGQHRWVEPGDIHNFDSTSIPPEWHGWMTSMNDTPPASEEAYFEAAKKNILPTTNDSHSPDDHNVGYVNEENTEKHNWKHFHNLTQVRSRGYGIGNPTVGLPPGVKDQYYTQPGSPYNSASMKPLEFIGDLDEGNKSIPLEQHRKYKSAKWADRLRTPEEKDAIMLKAEAEALKVIEAEKELTSKLAQQRASRGAGTLL